MFVAASDPVVCHCQELLEYLRMQVQLMHVSTAVFGLRHVVPAGLAQLQAAVHPGLEHQPSLARLLRRNLFSFPALHGGIRQSRHVSNKWGPSQVWLGTGDSRL